MTDKASNSALKLLDDLEIEYQYFEHPAVFTCEQADRLIPDLPGTKTKNLFLRNKKGDQHYLLVVPDSKAVDLKALAPMVGSTRLSFGSAERLDKHLGIEPGSVSILALINDPTRQVNLIIDQSIWGANTIQCHPLVNTATVVLSLNSLKTALTHLDRVATVINLPEIS